MITHYTFEKIFKEHLKIETYSKSIDSLFSPRLRNKIDYKPYYQRNYVWDYNKATYFIESILLGTEIPPLIFFDNNSEIEVIDGRQRFETILRFMENKFPLKAKGLQVLTQLKNHSYDDLALKDREIIDKFLDAKLRIIEFKLVNHPPLDKHLEDRVKKEIFSRYNSGITPLKKSEIDNAIYDENTLSSAFKLFFIDNQKILETLYKTFFIPTSIDKEIPIEQVMTFVRKNLVLPMTPISYYARGTGRTDLLSKLFEKLSDDNINSEKSVLDSFISKTLFLNQVYLNSTQNNLKINRLALETFLWMLGILDLEEKEYGLDDELKNNISKFIDLNIEAYSEIDYGFNKQVYDRYSQTGEFLLVNFNIDTSLYIRPNDEKRNEIKKLTKPTDTTTKLGELESLRLNKPEPSRISIDDVVRLMNKRRFLVRPSYQRKEVINPKKASSIIESIILGIALPAIFIFKREDGTSEVIDGQQRLLTLLGFIGSEYIDEKGKSQNSKNYKFSLRGLRILDDLNTCKFEKLTEDLQNKIYDFPLYVVEIDQQTNPQFDPIDLFIRLNDKPYPIRENSFEMWNSWADVDAINSIRDFKEKIKEWFYVKKLNNINDRDRMENEELMTSLIFLDYSSLNNPTKKVLDIYQKTDRLNSRVSDKNLISLFLTEINENNPSNKTSFFNSLKNIKTFILKTRYILLDCNKTKDELDYYLRDELDLIFKAGKESKHFRRTMQDFYFLWHILKDLNLEMIKHNRIEIKKDLTDLFRNIKNIPEYHYFNNDGIKYYATLLNNFNSKYKTDDRKVKLSEAQKLELISKQNNTSSLSSAPIFLGDEIEVDHIIPLAIGGIDNIENLGIAHKDENRAKGTKLKKNGI
ncbi:DUF262 domain-containing protein [Chryseobacterium sp. YR221]|uniref:GmrSD restriction endonuclease domain-containing protein n=1 Tax=Chryseobacterium sp. YR221 TaxID=1500293 RepID=UPI0009D7C99A|nr:DUF262 domain-containing protein [Chryseobacterium sp. YR221]SMD02330.1 HNH endonuclease [Chryseobacterium sp. YR221]